MCVLVPLKSDHGRHVLKPKIANTPFSPLALLLKPPQPYHTTPSQQVTPPKQQQHAFEMDGGQQGAPAEA